LSWQNKLITVGHSAQLLLTTTWKNSLLASWKKSFRPPYCVMHIMATITVSYMGLWRPVRVESLWRVKVPEIFFIQILES